MGSRRRGRFVVASALLPGAMLAYAACGRTELDPREAVATTGDAGRDSNVADVASEPAPPPPDAAADLDVVPPPPTPVDVAPDVPLPPPPSEAGPSTCWTQTVVTLATGQTAWGLLVDDQYLYWNDQYSGDLRRMPKKGGNVETMTTFDPSQPVIGLATDAANLYFAEWDLTNGGPLLRVPTDGGAPATLATVVGGWGIAVDDSNVYWTESGGWGSVHTVPKDGGAATSLASYFGPGNPMFVRVDDGYVYYTRWTPAGGVSRIPKQGGTSTILAVEPFALDLALDTNYVYFGTQTAGGGVWRVPKQGGTATQLVQDSNVRLVLDGGWVYYTQGAGVRKVPQAGGSAVDVATGQQTTGALAVDADCVYWSIDPGVSEIRVGPK